VVRYTGSGRRASTPCGSWPEGKLGGAAPLICLIISSLANIMSLRRTLIACATCARSCVGEPGKPYSSAQRSASTDPVGMVDTAPAPRKGVQLPLRIRSASRSKSSSVNLLDIFDNLPHRPALQSPQAPPRDHHEALVTLMPIETDRA